MSKVPPPWLKFGTRQSTGFFWSSGHVKSGADSSNDLGLNTTLMDTELELYFTLTNSTTVKKKKRFHASGPYSIRLTSIPV